MYYCYDKITELVFDKNFDSSKYQNLTTKIEYAEYCTRRCKLYYLCHNKVLDKLEPRGNNNVHGTKCMYNKKKKTFYYQSI